MTDALPRVQTTEAARVLVGAPDGVPVYASEAQCDYLAGLAMTLDVAPGDSGSFGLENGRTP